MKKNKRENEGRGGDRNREERKGGERKRGERREGEERRGEKEKKSGYPEQRFKLAALLGLALIFSFSL